MNRIHNMSYAKRILAWVLAVTVVLSILTIPQGESYAATGTVKAVAVTNLPAKQLTLKKGKTFTLKTKVTVSGKASKKVTYKTSNKKIVTVNAKGKITAKKKGTAKIYVISKANKKKKCTITVTVGTPVTKVKLNKTKSTMTVGKKQTLKATVTPKKASNKAVVWKSSNTKVATVSGKGVVKAKKAGTVTITATAKDGSGKKATCKITVKNKVKPAPAPVTVKSVKAIGMMQVQVELTGAKELSSSDFKIYKRKYSFGSYKKECNIDSVKTSDKITYKITLDTLDALVTGDMVQVVIAKMNYKGEAAYKGIIREQTTKSEIIKSVGYSINHYSDEKYYEPGLVGLCSFKITGELPQGITYKIIKDDDMFNGITDCLEFSGSFTKGGIYTTKIEVEDEIGNKVHHTITWKIADENRLMAADIVQYDYLRQEKGETKKSCHVDLDASVYGGNGSVEYEILKCSSEISYSKSAFGLNCILDTEKTGTYTLKAKVTDTEDASITTILSVTIIVKDSVAFKGCVYDLDGHKITSTVADVAAPYYISLYAKEKDTLCDASEFNDPESDGSFQIFVPDGTYDVFVASEAQDIGTWVCDSKVTASTPYQKIVLPVYQITIGSDNPAIDIRNFTKWRSNERKTIYGNVIYLTAGTHIWTSTATIDGVEYTATLNVTVTDKTRSTTVKAHVVAK